MRQANRSPSKLHIRCVECGKLPFAFQDGILRGDDLLEASFEIRGLRDLLEDF